MASTPEQPREGAVPQAESKETAEAPRGALFVIWSRATNRFVIEERDQNSTHYKGKSNFPGEHTEEADADIVDTALRGIQEETGQTISRDKVKPLMERLHKQPHADGSVAVFIVEVPDEFDFVASADGGRLSWKSLEEVRALIASDMFGFGQEQFFNEVETYVTSQSTHE